MSTSGVKWLPSDAVERDAPRVPARVDAALRDGRVGPSVEDGL
jgi:hypothetical protein